MEAAATKCALIFYAKFRAVRFLMFSFIIREIRSAATREPFM